MLLAIFDTKLEGSFPSTNFSKSIFYFIFLCYVLYSLNILQELTCYISWVWEILQWNVGDHFHF